MSDAPLVVLDEPTADLDPQSVQIVSAAVRRLQEERTMLVIAHRPELVERAHRVVALVNGAVVPAVEDRRAA
jgi:ABC-type transport system involved in cytochrome bd biosynthesis fused ATPase/permease subunit